MTNELIGKIKSRGYWRIVIRPQKFNKHLIPSLDQCLQYIAASKVSLRGWDYPHVDREGYANGIDWVESATDWMDILEYWRFYQSGQFANIFNCREDWVDLNQEQFMRLVNKPFPDGVLGVVATIYRLTEIYEFAARLASGSGLG